MNLSTCGGSYYQQQQQQLNLPITAGVTGAVSFSYRISILRTESNPISDNSAREVCNTIHGILELLRKTSHCNNVYPKGALHSFVLKHMFDQTI